MTPNPEGSRKQLAAECEHLRRHVADLEAKLLALQGPSGFETLLAANRLNHNIIRSAHEGIIVYGQDLRYQLWNPYMERLSGRKAAEVIGQHPLEIFPFLKEVGIIARLEQALAGELPEPLEFQFEVGGAPGWFVDASAPLCDDAGKVVGVIGTVQDITQRRRAEEALRATTHALGARARELHCLYGLARLNEDPGVTLEANGRSASACLPVPRGRMCLH